MSQSVEEDVKSQRNARLYVMREVWDNLNVLAIGLNMGTGRETENEEKTSQLIAHVSLS